MTLRRDTRTIVSEMLRQRASGALDIVNTLPHILAQYESVHGSSEEDFDSLLQIGAAFGGDNALAACHHTLEWLQEHPSSRRLDIASFFLGAVLVSDNNISQRMETFFKPIEQLVEIRQSVQADEQTLYTYGQTLAAVASRLNSSNLRTRIVSELCGLLDNTHIFNKGMRELLENAVNRVLSM